MGRKWNPEKAALGRVAETLVEQLFIELGWEVYRYGMENAIPGFTSVLRSIEKRAAVHKKISKMPDFVVHHEEKGTHMIEVKYRTSGEYKFEKGYEYYNPLFIVFSKRFIKCIPHDELEDSQVDDSYQKPYLLANRKEFNFSEDDRDKILEYCKVAVKFFEPF